MPQITWADRPFGLWHCGVTLSSGIHEIQRPTTFLQLINRVSVLEGAVADGERRDKDRMVALRGIVRAALARVGSSSPGADADDLMSHLERVEETDRKKESKWDSYRNSFTLLMSKSYLQTMDQLRDKLMAAEWEVGLRPMALQMGVARFEAYCGQNNIPITFDRITQLYDDPEDLSVIEDAHLRMQARAIIVSVETEQQLACWQMCTTEAQKLAQQFSEVGDISCSCCFLCVCPTEKDDGHPSNVSVAGRIYFQASTGSYRARGYRLITQDGVAQVIIG